MSSDLRFSSLIDRVQRQKARRSFRNGGLLRIFFAAAVTPRLVAGNFQRLDHRFELLRFRLAHSTIEPGLKLGFVALH